MWWVAWQWGDLVGSRAVRNVEGNLKSMSMSSKENTLLKFHVLASTSMGGGGSRSSPLIIPS